AVNAELSRYVESSSTAGLSRTMLQERMVLVMLNEAARCIEEDVVTAPDDVDFAMIMGTGFAPFRGGPLRYTDALGAAHVVDRLDQLASSEGDRFASCELLRTMARDGKTYYAK
ncbi:MAG: 3-hydroxyacyl-CoA dehydrogenase family protein, partial [Phycisphaerales bacterium]|nr:3-hydroxyacyl-CoA dehydrogenase family protein [Phycisphaerales bacterium]